MNTKTNDGVGHLTEYLSILTPEKTVRSLICVLSPWFDVDQISKRYFPITLLMVIRKPAKVFPYNRCP